MNVFRLVVHQHWPIFFIKSYHTPHISISEIMIPNHGNGPKSSQGACPGSKKHNTVCSLACLTPLLYAMHGNNSHYASGVYFIKYTQNAEKRQYMCEVKLRSD